jgi:hydrogenase expression/formation protein HypC
MCLAIPCKVLEILPDNKAIADIGAGVKKTVSLALLKDVVAGDYVLVHAGYAISKENPEVASDILKLLQEGAS